MPSSLQKFRYFLVTFFVFCFVLIIWSAPADLNAQESKRALTVDDQFKLKRVGDPQLSPEGKWVAYTVTEVNLEKDKSETRVWMASVSSGEAIPMTAKGSSASRPKWSPDGKYLSFLSSRDGEKTQVWTLDRRGGEAQQWTEVVQGVTGYEWSPDGTKLLLILQDPEPEDLEKDKDNKEKKKKPKPWVIDRLQFKMDYVGYLDRRRTHLFVFNLSDKKMTQITSGDFEDSQPA